MNSTELAFATQELVRLTEILAIEESYMNIKAELDVLRVKYAHVLTPPQPSPPKILVKATIIPPALPKVPTPTTSPT